MATPKKRSIQAAHVPTGARGRPPIHQEPWSKVSVVLLNRQIAFLDTFATRVRRENGTVVSRAQILRAAVDALAHSGINLTTIRSESELARRLMRKLSR